MTDYIEETVLERAVLAPDALGKEELARIRLHLDSCALCREQNDAFERMYQHVEGELQGPLTERDRQVAATILPRGLERRTPEQRLIQAYGDLIESYKRPIVSRFLRFIKGHPYQSSGAFVVAGGAVALLISIVIPARDYNPTYAEIKNYVLYAYNKEAEVIWKTGVPGLPDWTSTTSPSSDADRPRRLLSVEDIDGMNVNAVLLVGSAPSGKFTNDTLYCFERDGGLRWKTGIGEMLSIGQRHAAHHSRPQIADFLVIRRSSVRKPQIFVLANEVIYSPSKLFEVSAKNGTILQSYFNRGGCTSLMCKDLNLDGNEELLIGGVNDGFNLACLAVFDPWRVGGHSPVPPNEMPPGGSSGMEMYYVLFPRWGLGHRDKHGLYNHVGRLIDPQGGGIDVTVTEALLDPDNLEGINCSLYFSFGPRMSVERVMADDTVIRMGRTLFNQGKIQSPLTNSTFSSLKDSLLFWDGDRFVNTATLNKHYKDTIAATSTR